MIKILYTLCRYIILVYASYLIMNETGIITALAIAGLYILTDLQNWYNGNVLDGFREANRAFKQVEDELNKIVDGINKHIHRG